ncbi:MAG: T9SS type A sorting domain-containing protein [Bacteroidetes bacterium]|nr:T9SS type A sorting domain-containing protein [Bacteroidota bacterium]
MNPEILENASSYVSLELQPNPTSGIFTISTGANDMQADEIHIYDVNGRLVKSIVPEEITTNAISIDASDLNNGIYFVKLLNKATIHLSTKILIQK